MTNVISHRIRSGRFAPRFRSRMSTKAHNFYTRVLGFEKTFQNGDPAGFMILRNGQAELHLTLQPHSEAAPFAVAHLMVDGADALHAICESNGVRILKPLQDKEYGLRAFVFEDPDGNRIDVGQSIVDRRQQTGFLEA